MPGRSPHGERGLKSQASAILPRHARSRSPHGERGLKFEHAEHDVGGRVALLMESVD